MTPTRWSTSVEVLEIHEHGEHRHALLDHGLGLDLLHLALEPAVGKRVDGDRRRFVGADVSDIRFVEVGAHPHVREVGHLEQRGAAAHRVGGRLDDLPDLDVLLDDRAVGDGAHRRIGQRLGRDVEVGLLANHRGLRALVGEPCLLVLLRRDHLGGQHLVAALLLRGGDFELGLGRIEVGRRLAVLLLHGLRVDLGEERARLHVGARFHRHVGDHAGGFGAHLHDDDRFDGAVGFGRHDDVAPLDRLRLHDGKLVLSGAASGKEREGDQGGNLFHEPIPRVGYLRQLALVRRA
jgi:hypothetical protein